MKSRHQKQKEATERSAEQRAAADQLKRLDAKLGKGQGAKRERAKLMKALLDH